MRSLDLFAGAGGSLWAGKMLGWRCVAAVEIDPYCQEVLSARKRDGSFEPFLLSENVCWFDGYRLRGRVDIVTAGFPCQPYSSAGKRLGDADDRALWPQIVRIVKECEPAYVFLENSPRFLKYSEGLWNGLRELGFEWAPPLRITASHVGAIHRRERVYLLAGNPARIGREWGGGARRGGIGSEDSGLSSSDASSARCRKWQDAGTDCGDANSQRGWSGEPERGSEQPADPHRRRCEGQWCGWVFDRERQTFRHNSEQCGPWCRTRGTPWEAESPVCRVDDGLAPRSERSVRNKRLKALGNGWVPQQAVLAFQTLIQYFQ